MRCAALFLFLTLLCLPSLAQAKPLRVALFTAELDRTGPGLLLRDILKGEDPQILAALRVINHADPDVLVLLRFDYDHGQAALSAFADALGAAGSAYPHRFAFRPNSGMATGLDLDGDGRTGDARDSQGYGRFAGHRGMAILSKLPIDSAAARDFSGLLWADLPGAQLPVAQDGTPFLGRKEVAAQRLSSVGHWDIPVLLPSGARLHLLAFDSTPPLFDGPEDRNGLRNRDEIRFWPLLLDGALEPKQSWKPPDGAFVVIGNTNLDPARGQGLRRAISDLLDHPALTDPAPTAPGAPAGFARDTVHWPDSSGPKTLRVDYVLPSVDLQVVDSAVLWPSADDALSEDVQAASRHRLVWVDLELPQ